MRPTQPTRPADEPQQGGNDRIMKTKKVLPMGTKRARRQVQRVRGRLSTRLIA